MRGVSINAKSSTKVPSRWPGLHNDPRAAVAGAQIRHQALYWRAIK
jgi:hypothetical protein